ncbi:endonuclease/exonuclease/phosphatase family protein [Candidatus Manganitrophus noduliformans]|nr:endonuclease/exonuclease/phosphatase family protein [Candidatus Manganitrophus noduliformans]
MKIGSYNIENLIERFHEKYKSSRMKIPYGTPPSDFLDITKDRRFKNIKLSQEKLDRLSEVIRKNNADVLALQEVDDLDTLRSFNRSCLKYRYPYALLIEGNDPRWIDIGLLSKLPIGNVRTHQYLKFRPQGQRERYIFSRDLLEVDIHSHQREKLFTLFVNHLKSKREVGKKGSSDALRKRQAEAVRDRVKERFKDSEGAYIILGDMNDTPGSDPLQPLFELPVTSAFEKLQPQDRWTHYYKGGKEHNQLDHILLSRSLAGQARNPFIDRSGMLSTTPGLKLDEQNSKIRKKGEHASDHAAVFVELEI